MTKQAKVCYYIMILPSPYSEPVVVLVRSLLAKPLQDCDRHCAS